jgi:DNA-binding HxlR family transcriptional regulator
MEEGTSMSVGHTGDTAPCASPDIRATMSCEIRDLLDRLADKWSLLVVELLGRDARRFSELRRQIDGISQRMLTLTLRHLERDGLVTRTVYPVVPPRVEYRLTPLGAGLLEAVGPLVAWTRAHRADITGAQAAYDATESGPPDGVARHGTPGSPGHGPDNRQRRPQNKTISR